MHRVRIMSPVGIVGKRTADTNSGMSGSGLRYQCGCRKSRNHEGKEKIMDLVIVLGAFVLAIVSWIIWAILTCLVFCMMALLPWGIWEIFMYLTFNNIINAAAKVPGFFGYLLGFVLTLPATAVATTVSIWTYIQTFLMGLLTFRGLAHGFSNTFIEECVAPLESGWPGSLVLVRFYYERFQWLWGGAGFQYSYYPWQNGCGPGWKDGSFWCQPCETPVVFWIIKLFLLVPVVAETQLEFRACRMAGFGKRKVILLTEPRNNLSDMLHDIIVCEIRINKKKVILKRMFFQKVTEHSLPELSLHP